MSMAMFLGRRNYEPAQGTSTGGADGISTRIKRDLDRGRDCDNDNSQSRGFIVKQANAD